MTKQRPLVLDVDGTFLRTDLLFECFWAGLGKAPLATLKATFANLGNRQRLKERLAEIADLRMDLMPVNPAVRAYADAAKAEGREVVLASASDQSLVTELAREHGLSERVFASQPGTNLKGARKAEALTQAYGAGGFDYAGNEAVDRAIWDKAAQAIVVGDPASAEAMRSSGKEVTELAGGWTGRDLLKALRPHQWVKNVLLLVPLIAAHSFGMVSLAWVLLGMAVFSAAASSIYIINDLLDLEADRLHKTKHKRPFASGAVPIQVGMLAFLVLSLFALITASLLGLAFFVTIVIYVVLSLAYSLRLKRLRWVDIGVLAALYTLRVVAGATAVDVETSGFLLAFIFPTFLALGCVKRLTEVTLATSDARLPGRGYGRLDRDALLNVAILGAFLAVLVFVLYSFSPHGLDLYNTQWLIWLAAVPLTLWMVRMILLGYYGKQDYDPIVFALRDKFGLGLLMLMLSILFYAAGLWQAWFG